MLPKVDIIILNYNGYKDTIECIRSLKKITYDNIDIIIIDNKSTDDSQNKIKKFIDKEPNIRFIQSGENIGFSGGNNIGIDISIKNKSDYICLLNNDTIVEPGFLEPLVEAMEKDKSIGLASGKIMYYDEPNKIWCAGGYINKLTACGYHYGRDQIDNGKYNENKKVSDLPGCLQLIRREVFENIGLYDEKYFLYMEDTDFCYRANQAGYKLMYISESKIYHKVSSSTGGQNSPLHLYYMARNRILFNRAMQLNLFEDIIFYMFYMFRFILEPFRRKKNFKYVLKGVGDGLKGISGKKFKKESC